MFKIFPQVVSRGEIHLSISSQQSEGQVGVGVCDGSREYARPLCSYINL